jgi:hypothetical protein
LYDLLLKTDYGVNIDRDSLRRLLTMYYFTQTDPRFPGGRNTIRKMIGGENPRADVALTDLLRWAIVRQIPSPETKAKVLGLVGQLNDDSYKVRTKASDELTSLSVEQPGISTILQPLLADQKNPLPPEAKWRVQAVLRNLSFEPRIVGINPVTGDPIWEDERVSYIRWVSFYFSPEKALSILESICPLEVSDPDVAKALVEYMEKIKHPDQ